MTDAAATSLEEHANNIDLAVAAILRLLNFFAKFSRPLAAAMPILTWIIKYKAHQLKGELADGTIVPDGGGGFVPASNSRVHPSNGRFIKWTGIGWVYDDFLGGAVIERIPPPR